MTASAFGELSRFPAAQLHEQIAVESDVAASCSVVAKSVADEDYARWLRRIEAELLALKALLSTSARKSSGNQDLQRAQRSLSNAAIALEAVVTSAIATGESGCSCAAAAGSSSSSHLELVTAVASWEEVAVPATPGEAEAASAQQPQVQQQDTIAIIELCPRASLATAQAVRNLQTASCAAVDLSRACGFLETIHTTRGAACAYEELLRVASEPCSAEVKQAKVSIRDVAVLRCACEVAAEDNEAYFRALDVALGS